VLAGSLPRNTNPNVYAQLCSKLKRKGAKVIIDADGQALTESIKAKPDFIKPNLHELCNYFKIKNNKITVNQIALLGKKIIAKGINNLAVSLGSRGSLFFDKHTVIFANALGINIKSTVGAGDSMVAAVAYGLQHKLS
jgi:1-phosphofructokinase